MMVSTPWWRTIEANDQLSEGASPEMSARAVPRAVIFDVGGVLLDARPDAAEIAVLLGMNGSNRSCVDLVEQSLATHRDSYDHGTTDREFWDRIAGDCGLGEINDECLSALVAKDTTRMHEPEAESIALVAELKDAGVPLFLLSNAPQSLGEELRRTQWVRTYFDDLVISAEVGLGKPNRGIFREALARFGYKPQEVVFVDDRKENVRAAELFGIHAFVWKGAEATRERFKMLGLLAS